MGTAVRDTAECVGLGIAPSDGRLLVCRIMRGGSGSEGVLPEQ